MFGADADLAAELRNIAASAFSVPLADQPKQGLIHKVGPMFRRDPNAIVVPLEHPVPNDWEALIAGRYVAPERLVASWKVVDAWVDARDVATTTFTMDTAEAERFDFSLSKAGLPSQFGLRQLMAQDVSLPLRPAHGLVVGYSKNQHVLATAEELAKVIDQVEEGPQGPAHHLLDFLQAFRGFTDQARASDRVLPDLFVAWWETSRAELRSAAPGDPIRTGRQARGPAPDQQPHTGRQPKQAFDPTAPMVTGRQTRRQPPR